MVPPTAIVRIDPGYARADAGRACRARARHRRRRRRLRLGCAPRVQLRRRQRPVRDSGDRTLMRVDPSTGDAVPVGGGLAPCGGDGLAADPSGDVWVRELLCGRFRRTRQRRAGRRRRRSTSRRPGFVPAGDGYFTWSSPTAVARCGSGGVSGAAFTIAGSRKSILATGAQRPIGLDRSCGLASLVGGLRRPLDERLRAEKCLAAARRDRRKSRTTIPSGSPRRATSCLATPFGSGTGTNRLCFASQPPDQGRRVSSRCP